MSGFLHTPVMVAEVVTALKPEPGGWYVDGTVGGGGHAAAILETSSPTGSLFGCDLDSEAIAAAQERLKKFDGRFELRQGNFSHLSDWLEPASCDGVLFDLGISSPQVEWPERGFSFQKDGPLDMRMDRLQALTAADLVNEASPEELADIFWKLGGEPAARRLARAIERERRERRFETTRQLAELVARLSPRYGKRTHPATRLFQALRLAVNDEIGSLQRGLVAALTVLRSGGRLVVITFHSLEDRVVKQFGRERARDYTVEGDFDLPEFRKPRPPELKCVNRKAIQPSAVEVAANQRARSAQLRIFEKV